MIRNLGQAPAYNISLIEPSTDTNLTIGELEAGQGMELSFPLSPITLVFSTGPSRTADIELTVTLGVHGLKNLYVWM